MESMGTVWATCENSGSGALPHALGRRVGRDQVGELFFQLFELLEKVVVFAVGDDRLSEDVVPVVVVLDLLA